MVLRQPNVTCIKILRAILGFGLYVTAEEKL
jgi:hypothetical protein